MKVQCLELLQQCFARTPLVGEAAFVSIMNRSFAVWDVAPMRGERFLSPVELPHCLQTDKVPLCDSVTDRSRGDAIDAIGVVLASTLVRSLHVCLVGLWE